MKIKDKIKRLIIKIFAGPKIKIKGNNNILDIARNAHMRKVKIKIYGNNNKLIIEEKAYLHNVYMRIGFPDCPIDNCTIKIGKKTSFNSADMQLGESNSSITIGDNCMFSFNIEITCTDTHSIFDESNNLVNIGSNISIGSHVWVCKNVTILKNTAIPDNCVVAQGSIITKKFEEQSAILAGNPANIVKKNIKWDKIRPQYAINERNKLQNIEVSE